MGLICRRAAPPGKVTVDIYPQNHRGSKPPGFPGCEGDIIAMLTGGLGTIGGLKDIKEGHKRGWLGVTLGAVDFSVGIAGVEVGSC
jgi:hypothetical protein